MNSIKMFLLKPEYYDNYENIKVRGWVSANRGNKKMRFLMVNDGSTVANLQVVFKGENFDYELLDQVNLGAAVEIVGTLKATPEAKQPIELLATEFKLLKNTNDFPIQNQEIALETLREIPHVRHRTNFLKCVMLIRSTLAQEIHRFFMTREFYYMSSPIITSNDGEGAGETFNVDDDSKEPFFGKGNRATLGVTGQLHAESYAIGMKKVYTFAPTFRAENSNTKKHAAEFWMVEPEVAFYDLKDDIKLADDMLKVVIRNTIAKHPFEFDYLVKNIDENLLVRLNKFLESDLKVIEYRKAIEELAKVKDRFENQDIKFGLDLATEHERYISEVLFDGPVAVINFPKDFKAFYMKQNNDNETVAAFDLLVPGIGELIGGSQREENYDKLLKRINELNIDAESLEWYLNLRNFGDSGSAGFGLGFERLVMYVTGADNIRDVIPYPRTSGNIRM
ncbi:asparagine--tRNA ligase [Mycoplasmopsis pullorum]|uniref:asparagine--tRNA ligase n=1 Tax=Mycoplasmopsis pullorum TaxID=48003 RepID=UPI001117EF50|nr:asparagine--tRNA ligase [Mycoplasmopsis pullorum]TNK83838.1 asparagine--tRNA ligase [Mycoplasmopsis pullorum]TNK92452.1 asparagine--tRNA ligase [Mycoplasmopsis pullorum]